tara:strand:+ start:1082 stop:1780 length:699 start_codon:yes stop_codon:yes gene_type:complete
MKVAILYSGGKDSTFAIQHAKEQGWDIRYLLSIKPTRKDCYCFHYATVEHTPDLAKMIGIHHILKSCNVADPKLEADIVKQVVQEQEKVDAVILGGTGLQETQLGCIQAALKPMNIEVFAAHVGEDHDLVIEKMIEKGYKILISQVASDGLKNWLGKYISKDNFDQFKSESQKYGFHVGGEGGYFDTLIVDAPYFTQKLEIEEFKTVMDDEYCGHIELTKFKLVPKVKILNS